MKARVIETGKIVDIIRNSAFDKDVFYDSDGQKYNREELSFDFREKSFPKDDHDYWTRLEHQYAGMAMQGILANYGVEPLPDDAAHDAYNYAHALVEMMKEVRK
jgi:hypothetical protein